MKESGGEQTDKILTKFVQLQLLKDLSYFEI